MSNPTPTSSGLFATLLPHVAYVTVRGKANLALADSIKSFGCQVAKENEADLVIDLAPCTGLDSTFMGVLVGIVHAFQHRSKHTVALTNVSLLLQDQLSTLGLNQMVGCYAPKEVPDPFHPIVPPDQLSPLERSQADQPQTARMMLTAHQNLADLSAENQARFKDVIDLLQQDQEPDT